MDKDKIPENVIAMDAKRPDANDYLEAGKEQELMNQLADAANKAKNMPKVTPYPTEETAGSDNNSAGAGFNPADPDLAKLNFISPAKLNDFIKAKNSPPSPTRNEVMVQIIRDSLEWKINKKGERVYIMPSAENFYNILNADPVIANLFGYEEFKGETVLLRQPAWAKTDRIKTEWTDADDCALRFYLRKNYKDLSSKWTTDDIFSVIAQEHAFNVVKEHLEKMPAWDGRKRAETLFVDFLGVPNTKLARAVTMKWLLAAVARIYFPGCDFQNALVLQGQQNIGKTYILKMLGGEWYGVLIDSVDDTHAIDAIKNLWIVEIQEMAAARKAEINAVKSFIERPADNHRAAYARRAQTFKRHCVFAITANDRQFLRDQTGNRRYWILESTLAEFGYIDNVEGVKLDKEYVNQVWAEVLHKFEELTRNGFNDRILELPKELKVQAELIAERFTYDDGLQTEIPAFLDKPILPPILWNSLTKEEKRKFFDSGYIELDNGDWYARRDLIKSDEKRQKFDAALDDEKYIRRIVIPRGKDNPSDLRIAVYGSYIRRETCASEIYNECFKNDRRNNIWRICEVLDKLVTSGQWRKATKQVKNFNGYGNQKNIYCRVESSETADLDPPENLAQEKPDKIEEVQPDEVPLPF